MVPLQHCHGPFLSPQPEGPTQTTGDTEGGREGEEVACLSLLLQVTACIPFLFTHCQSLAWSQGAEQMAPAGFASSQQDSFPLNAQISVRKSSLICHYCRFPFQGIPDLSLLFLPLEGLVAWQTPWASPTSSHGESHLSLGCGDTGRTSGSVRDGAGTAHGTCPTAPTRGSGAQPEVVTRQESLWQARAWQRQG